MEVPKAEDEDPKAKSIPNRYARYLPSAGYAAIAGKLSDQQEIPTALKAELVPIGARYTPNNMDIPFIPNPNNVRDDTMPIAVAERYQPHLEQSQSLPSGGYAAPVFTPSNFPVALATPIAESMPTNERFTTNTANIPFIPNTNDIRGEPIAIPVAQLLQNSQDLENPDSFGFQAANPLGFGHLQAPQVQTNQQQQSTNANSPAELSNAEWLAGIVSNTSALSPQRQQDLFDAYVRDRNGNGNGNGNGRSR